MANRKIHAIGSGYCKGYSTKRIPSRIQISDRIDDITCRHCLKRWIKQHKYIFTHPLQVMDSFLLKAKRGLYRDMIVAQCKLNK